MTPFSSTLIKFRVTHAQGSPKVGRRDLQRACEAVELWHTSIEGGGVLLGSSSIPTNFSMTYWMMHAE